MKKIAIVFLCCVLSILLMHCNTPTESMGQSNPVLKFSIEKSTYLKVAVNNLIGDEIVSLAKKEFQAGEHWVSWDGKNNKGEYVDEGFYHFSIYLVNGKLWRTQLVYFKRN